MLVGDEMSWNWLRGVRGKERGKRKTEITVWQIKFIKTCFNFGGIYTVYGIR